MYTLRRAFLAGVLASLVLALFDFVTDGAPGNGFPAVLRWFGLTVDGALPDAHADAPLSRYGFEGHADGANALVTSDLAALAPAGITKLKFITAPPADSVFGGSFA